MKIRTEQLEALQQQEQARAKSKPETGKFGDMLAQEVQKATSPAGLEKPQAPPPGANVIGVNQLLSAEPAEQVSKAEAVIPSEREVMDNIDSLLNKWENYADTLKTGQPDENLRQAYGVLENIQTEVRELKGSVPNMDEAYPNLKSMVDELEIMTVTERIKFNRGDYI